MPPLQRVSKPKTRKGKQFLLNRESKVIENSKQALFIKGRKTSEVIRELFKDIYDLKKPQARMMSRNNDILPFENSIPLEEFSKKYNASLFFFASSNKKRPNNLVLGRMFDHHVLDMIELGIESYKGLSYFKNDKVSFGIKPCLLFAGDMFEKNFEYQRIKNLLVDLFQREQVEAIRLQGLEHVLMFTAADNKIFMRSYKILLKKSGTRIPRIELEEIGPSADLTLRRTQLASEDLYKSALKKPKELKIKKTKNISKDTFGTKHGRIHMQPQNLDKLTTRKMKGLKRTASERKAIKKRKTENGPEEVKD